MELIAKSANKQFRLTCTENESKRNIENDLLRGPLEKTFSPNIHAWSLWVLVGFLMHVDEQVHCMKPWSLQVFLLI